MRDGGRVLVAGATPPPLARRHASSGRRTTQGYWRVHDHQALPSLKDTDLLFLDGDYVELAPVDRPAAHADSDGDVRPAGKSVERQGRDDACPGSCSPTTERGASRTFRGTSAASTTATARQAHAGLMADVIDRLLPDGRQLKTDAHPLVEMTVMDQPARGRTLVHLVNGTGHQDTAYFPPVELRDIRIELARDVRRVRAVESRPGPAGHDQRTLPVVHAAEPQGVRGHRRRVGRLSRDRGVRLSGSS